MKDEMGRACNTSEKKRKAFRILVRKLERKSPKGRPRHRWEDNIKIAVLKSGVVWAGLI
jgi:hypothetical protein